MLLRCVWKITDSKVIQLLSKMENTEATIAYLNLMQSVLKAFVLEATSVTERIFHAVYVVTFVRIWRQWLFDNGISTKHFVTQNSWEGLELNLILLLKLALDNNAENIYFMNSQICESFFRLIRSYTSMESMVVNCSIKSILGRIHRLQLEEILMKDLNDNQNLKFPKLLSRAKHVKKAKSNLTREQIENTIQDAFSYAVNQAKEVEMVVQDIKLERFLTPVNINSLNDEESDDEPEDLLRSTFDSFRDQNLNNLSFDESQTSHEFIGTFSLENMELSDEQTGDFTTLEHF